MSLHLSSYDTPLLTHRKSEEMQQQAIEVGRRQIHQFCREPCYRYGANSDSVSASEAMEKFSVEKVPFQADENCGSLYDGLEMADAAR